MSKENLIELTRFAILYKTGWEGYLRHMGCDDTDIAKILDMPETAQLLVRAGAVSEMAIAF